MTPSPIADQSLANAHKPLKPTPKPHPYLNQMLPDGRVIYSEAHERAEDEKARSIQEGK